MFSPLFCIGDYQWFDTSFLRVYDAKQMAYHACCRSCNVDYWGQFVLARAKVKVSVVL